MGISSAPEVFSKVMQEVLQGLNGVANLIDDVGVHGRTKEEHDGRLQAVMERMKTAGVTLNEKKCKFGCTSLKYLGFIVSSDGILPDDSKVAAITKFPQPKDIADVRRFLGMVNNLALFIPNLATIIEPIRALLCKNVVFNWSHDQDKAFEKVKEVLVSPEVLALYDPRLPTRVAADSSSYGLGAVLMQQVDGTWRPISYISRSLTPAEGRYAPIEKEALAVTWACERFSQYLVGLAFEIQTDHSPLVALLSKKRLDVLPVRIQRFRIRLLRFCYEVKYIPGKEQIVADALSRAPVTEASEEELHLNAIVEDSCMLFKDEIPATEKRLLEIKDKQHKDPILNNIIQFCQSQWPERPALEFLRYSAVKHELYVIDGLLIKGRQVVIPPSLHADVLDKIHQGHQGINKCLERTRNAVWWPDFTVHIKELVSRCTVCIEHRVNNAEPMISTPWPERPWQ